MSSTRPSLAFSIQNILESNGPNVPSTTRAQKCPQVPNILQPDQSRQFNSAQMFSPNELVRQASQTELSNQIISFLQMARSYAEYINYRGTSMNSPIFGVSNNETPQLRAFQHPFNPLTQLSCMHGAGANNSHPFQTMPISSCPSVLPGVGLQCLQQNWLSLNGQPSNGQSWTPFTMSPIDQVSCPSTSSGSRTSSSCSSFSSLSESSSGDSKQTGEMKSPSNVGIVRPGSSSDRDIPSAMDTYTMEDANAVQTDPCRAKEANVDVLGLQGQHPDFNNGEALRQGGIEWGCSQQMLLQALLAYQVYSISFLLLLS